MTEKDGEDSRREDSKVPAEGISGGGHENGGRNFFRPMAAAKVPPPEKCPSSQKIPSLRKSGPGDSEPYD